MSCSMLGFPALHCLPEFAQTHFQWILLTHVPPTISSSVAYFSFPQSFPASGSFPMSQLFASGGQSIAVSASTSVLPMNIQDWSPLEWTGLISLQSKGLSRVFSNTTVQKHQFFGARLSCAAIHGVAKSWTRLSDWTELNWSHILGKNQVKIDYFYFA